MESEQPFIYVSLEAKTTEKYIHWRNQCMKDAIEKQRAENPEPSDIMKKIWELGYPYSGAIGGDISFIITPTSLGMVIKAEYPYLNRSIDLTEYDLW